MATSSSWRTSSGNGTPHRWGQAASSNNNSSNNSSAQANVTTPAAVASAASVPRSVSNDTEAIQRDRMMYLLVGLVGNTVVATTRSGVKYVGILNSTTAPGEAESLGIVLSCAQQILKDGGLGQVKKMLMIKGEDLDSFSAKDVGLDAPVSMSNANRAGFRTDTEISKKALEPFGEGRTLQKWAGDNEALSLEEESAFADMPKGGTGNSEGGGGKGGLGGWDQFAANEARFGVKSNYEETLYTTKLDKTAKDYKDREKKAEQLAKEIMNSSTNNIHVAEERNMTKEAEDGQTEEDRYGAVVRGPNAYIHPAARRAAAVAAAAGAQNTIKANGAAREDKANGAPSTNNVEIPIITNTPAIKDGVQTTSDAVGDFRQFVSSEREKIEKKKAALAKKEKDTKLADLKNWGDKFKLKFKSDEAGDRSKVEKLLEEKPRGDSSVQKSVSPNIVPSKDSKNAAAAGSGTLSVDPSPKVTPAKSYTEPSAATKAQLAETKAMLAKMTIPKIPPFNPEKARAKQAELQAASNATDLSTTGATSSISKTAFKLSAKASSFKPFNPNAAAFTPGAASAAVVVPTAAAAPSMGVVASPPSVSSRAPSENVSLVNSPRPIISSKMAGPSLSIPLNPFFGNRVLKKTTSLHVRDDFNPFKSGKVPDSQTVGPTWGFSGKGYRTLFHIVAMDEGNGTPHMVHLQQQQPMSHPSMTPVHNMVHMGMHPQGVMGQQGLPPTIVPPPPHLQQQQHNPTAMASNNGQQQAYYLPYGAAAAQGAPYRFQGGQQPMQQMPVGYGQMQAHYLPFSPPMPPNAPPVYSPQMGNMFPHSASMHNMGVSPAQVPPTSRNNSQMQGKVPPHMYYANTPYQQPNSAGPMTPVMRQQQPQQHQQPQQPLSHPPPPPPPQQQQQQQQHLGTPSQAGSATG